MDKSVENRLKSHSVFDNLFPILDGQLTCYHCATILVAFFKNVGSRYSTDKERAAETQELTTNYVNAISAAVLPANRS